MHSTEETDFRGSPKALSSEQQHAFVALVALLPAATPVPPGEDAQRIRHVELVQRHRDLDDTVAKLSEVAACDELLLARLKKRKLQIKDSIARLEALLSHCATKPHNAGSGTS
jgi:hypothetical protein